VACITDADCGGEDGYVCACAGNSEAQADGTCGAKVTGEGAPYQCDARDGRCVLKQCRDDVAAFQRKTCNDARTPQAKADCEAALGPCEIGGETCKFLACVDDKLGNFTDGRQVMVGR
jgi:5'-nucleotidase